MYTYFIISNLKLYTKTEFKHKMSRTSQQICLGGLAPSKHTNKQISSLDYLVINDLFYIF